MFRLQNNVPEYYADKSRDFQLFCRLYDSTFCCSKYSIDSLRYTSQTNFCNEQLLELLKTKLGFFSNQNIDNNDLRLILKAFPDLIRYKGSKHAVESLVYLFLRISKSSETAALIDNDLLCGEITESGLIQHTDDRYELQITFQNSIKYESLFRELLEYVMPTGYLITVKTRSGSNNYLTKVPVGHDVGLLVVDLSSNGVVSNNEYEELDKGKDVLFTVNTVGKTIVVVPTDENLEEEQK